MLNYRRQQVLLALLLAVAGSVIAPAQENAATGVAATGVAEGRQPEALRDTGVTYKLGQALDPTIAFRDEQNNHVAIGEYFDGRRPFLLSFNYSNCPAQCSVQLEKITLALRQIDFSVGQDFQVVSVSIDPNEQSSRARETRDKYVQLYNRAGTEQGWHFLTGENADIKRLAEQCGIKYKYIPRQKLYSHPPVFLLISPEGKIVRYIEGFDYVSSTVKLALVDAAAGKIGSPLVFLTYVAGCFVYDDSTGQYTFAALGLMRIGGAATVVVLLITLVPYWFFRRKDKGQTPDTIDHSGTTTMNQYIRSDSNQAQAT